MPTRCSLSRRLGTLTTTPIPASETESREGSGDDSSLSAPPMPTIAAGVHMKVDTVDASNADCVPDTADASAAAT
eukprot:1817640-Pleurochrysis_carterae.AAC.1